MNEHYFWAHNVPPDSIVNFLYIAIFENHIAFIVGRQLTRNDILPHACGKEGDHKKSYIDPLTNSTTHSTHESSHVSATITTSKNGAMKKKLKRNARCPGRHDMATHGGPHSPTRPWHGIFHRNG